MRAIGIDLGTTNSCVAVYRKDQIEVIVNDDGKRVTPSYVSFTEDEVLVGDAAKKEARYNIENTLFQIKRLIGRTYDDPIVKADMKLWGFKILNDNNKPKISISVKNDDEEEVVSEQLSPEEVSAKVLEVLVEAAKARLDNKPVTDAVITVPAYFNDAQRSATRNAGEIAGLNVLRMINEPTAAAIAYGLDRESSEKQNVLVFDLGGGTFDVTIVIIEEGMIDVQATGGNTHLGGHDFDNRLVEHFIKEFNDKNNCDMSENKTGRQLLQCDCEMAKIMLSSKTAATVQVDSLHNGKPFKSKISRATFEELNYDLFTKMMEIVSSTLSDANMDKDEIDNVVLVGGSTRIPKVRELVKKYFGEKKVKMNMNPDESVACGAAALAAKLSSNDFPEIGKLSLRDVTPLSLGWRKYTGEMAIVIKRNTKIPTEGWDNSQTALDYQTVATTNIYEGERPMAEDNHFLGKITIEGIPSALKGVEKFKTCFSLDENGILTVTDHSVSTGKSKQITIHNSGRLSNYEVQGMIRKAKKYKEKDAAMKERVKHFHQLEEFVYAVKHSVDDEKFSRISSSDINAIIRKCTEISRWMELNNNPEIYESKQKQEELENACKPIFKKIPDGIEYFWSLKKQ